MFHPMTAGDAGSRDNPSLCLASMPSSPAGAGDGEYRVGYGRPPREHRFKPGQSGNPRGRRRKTYDMDEVLCDVLFSMTKARTPFGVKRIPIIQAVVFKLLELAIAGDVRASKILLEMGGRAVIARAGKGAGADGDPEQLSAADKATLAALEQSLSAEIAGQGGEGLA